MDASTIISDIQKSYKDVFDTSNSKINNESILKKNTKFEEDSLIKNNSSMKSKKKLAVNVSKNESIENFLNEIPEDKNDSTMRDHNNSIC